MSRLHIRNWEKWQSYRGDRGQPPWIKVHRRVMRNPDWVALTDAQRGQMIGIWLLAADNDGYIPSDSLVVQKLCYMDSTPDLKLFINHGFIDDDVNVTSNRRQSDAPEAETEAETEDNPKKDYSSSGTPADCPHQAIIDLYHQTLPMLPQVREWTPARAQQLRTRWREEPERQTLDYWQRFFEYVKTSDFLCGRVTPAKGKKPFLADLEWLTKSANFTKVREGKYDNG